MRTVVLHGFVGAPAAWADVSGRAGVDPIAPWLVGHGRCPAFCIGTTFDDAVDDLARLLPSGEPCALVAYSMGARLGLRLLVRHPTRFTHAVLVGAHPGLGDAAAAARRRAWEQDLRASVLAHGVPAFVDAWEALPVLRTVRSVPAERLARRRAWRLAHTAAGLAHALDVLGLGVMPDSSAALTRLEVPTTLVAGADDAKFVASAHAMAERLPRATVALVPRCGHDVALEAPEELARLIRAAEERA